MLKRFPHGNMKRLLPLAAFLLVAAVGAGVTAVVYRTEETANRARFEAVADEAADRISDRVKEHVALLVATASFLKASGGAVPRAAFRRFVEGLDLDGEFDGVHGIGIARVAAKEDDAAVAAEIARSYGVERGVWPETDQPFRTPIVVLEPERARSSATLGFDMYSEASRREAMNRAIASGKVRATAPVELLREVPGEAQTGFLAYYPLPESRPAASRLPAVSGFVYAPFLAHDLHTAALDERYGLPVEIETRDTTANASVLLYRSADYAISGASPRYRLSRTIDVAGRTWTLSMHETPGYMRGRTNFYSFIVGAISLLLAAAIAASARWQIRAVESAEQLRAVSEQAVKDKELILQEMKHRLKNAIARILAMARQTGAHADTVEDFSSSLSARLQAMANAQDMLARSRWQRADLRDLLMTELNQVFGDAAAESRIAGESVELNEKQTQAFALTFHELATNTLKYGSGAESKGGLSVHWTLAGPPRGRMLDLTWEETTGTAVAEPESRGFGSRLIDANIKGELGGTVERSYGENGFSIRIVVPYR
ncbi:histidine kinase [Nitratireductor mangrovi]|uniref:histidine kinase n=1 Tax=Nitratireductor mangrovi TaxID=2599600 RepID=A0A5B8L2Y3_9HYPH|nr:CHASE domain-containing protein [Nitratireductor mangrovi]QDZ02245.1 histidine kinase [Nitratireductor mangrovi]